MVGDCLDISPSLRVHAPLFIRQLLPGQAHNIPSSTSINMPRTSVFPISCCSVIRYLDEPVSVAILMSMPRTFSNWLVTGTLNRETVSCTMWWACLFKKQLYWSIWRPMCGMTLLPLSVPWLEESSQPILSSLLLHNRLICSVSDYRLILNEDLVKTVTSRWNLSAWQKAVPFSMSQHPSLLLGISKLRRVLSNIKFTNRLVKINNL